MPTPNTDRRAAEGLRFTAAHTPAAVGTPTRYGFLMGRDAWRTRLRNSVLWSDYEELLIFNLGRNPQEATNEPVGEPTLGARLQAELSRTRAATAR